MKNKKVITGMGIPADAEDAVIKAVVDLNEFFDEIKNSRQFTKYLKQSHIISKMFFNTLVAFTIGQVVDMAKKAAMINHNDNNRELTPEERFAVIMNEVLSHMQNVAEYTFERKLP